MIRSFQERIRLLGEVERLAKSIGQAGDVGYTCENAGNFYRYTVGVGSWLKLESRLAVLSIDHSLRSLDD